MTEAVGPVAEAAPVYRPGYSRAAEQIMQYIDEQGFRPGDRLPTEARFSELLGISRTIARDALKTLAAMGRITIQRGRGIYVADSADFSEQVTNAFIPTSIDHVMMLFEFRGIQERAAAELAAHRATPAELVAIGKALADYTTAAETGDVAAAAKADEAFHRAVAAASHNRLLAESIASAQSLQHRVVVAAFGGFSGGPVMKARDEHAAILDSIRNGDAEAAGRGSGCASGANPARISGGDRASCIPEPLSLIARFARRTLRLLDGGRSSIGFDQIAADGFTKLPVRIRQVEAIEATNGESVIERSMREHRQS